MIFRICIRFYPVHPVNPVYFHQCFPRRPRVTILALQIHIVVRLE